MKITYYQRRPFLGSYSVERLFDNVRDVLPPGFSWSVFISSYHSKGFLPRLFNALEAIWRQSSINHVTGEVHYLTVFLKKKKTILTILDCVALERLNGIRKSVLFFFWYWLPEKRSALITVISESTKREVLRYLRCDPDKIRVVPCCISPDFKYIPREFNAARPKILQVGTTENKNLLRLAAALEGIPCHLRIIGKISIEQKTALERHRIEFTSAADISNEELVQNYEECDLVVFASTYEGFGLPIIEANATGRAVVTSDILSMPEVAGDAACLVNPFNVESIRSGILRIIENSDYRKELVRKGFSNVERFKPQVIAAQYANLYNEIFSSF